MPKPTIKGMQKVLEDLGFSKPLTNARSARVAMAFAGLDLEKDWSEASCNILGIHEVIEFINKGVFDRGYAENTRETIRDDTVKPFVEHGLLIKNPQGNEAHNSAKTKYCLIDEAVTLFASVETADYQRELVRVCARLERMAYLAAARSEAHRQTIVLPTGETVDVTGEGQNALIAGIVEQFIPQAYPKGKLLYIADAGGDIFPSEEPADLVDFVKRAVTEVGLSSGFVVKPDVVIYDESEDALVVLEACVSTGVIDESRKRVLDEAFAGPSRSVRYYTCFLSREEMRPWLSKIAWNTSVWCMNEVFHMIRFD